MELIKLKLLDTDGMTLLTAPAAGQVSLVYMNAYKPGDRVSLEIGTPGQYVVIQFEDTMAPPLVYVVKRLVCRIYTALPGTVAETAASDSAQ